MPPLHPGGLWGWAPAVHQERLHARPAVHSPSPAKVGARCVRHVWQGCMRIISVFSARKVVLLVRIGYKTTQRFMIPLVFIETTTLEQTELRFRSLCGCRGVIMSGDGDISTIRMVQRLLLVSACGMTTIQASTSFYYDSVRMAISCMSSMSLPQNNTNFRAPAPCNCRYIQLRRSQIKRALWKYLWIRRSVNCARLGPTSRIQRPTVARNARPTHSRSRNARLATHVVSAHSCPVPPRPAALFVAPESSPAPQHQVYAPYAPQARLQGPVRRPVYCVRPASSQPASSQRPVRRVLQAKNRQRSRPQHAHYVHQEATHQAPTPARVCRARVANIQTHYKLPCARSVLPGTIRCQVSVLQRARCAPPGCILQVMQLRLARHARLASTRRRRQTRGQPCAPSVFSAPIPA